MAILTRKDKSVLRKDTGVNTLAWRIGDVRKEFSIVVCNNHVASRSANNNFRIIQPNMAAVVIG